jgi:hypothetical protein
MRQNCPLAIDQELITLFRNSLAFKGEIRGAADIQSSAIEDGP